MAVELCPWLGTIHDRDVRYVEPDAAHVCLAQTPPAEIAYDYQTGYCLAPGHVTCRHYRQSPAPSSRSARVASEQVEDEVGPPPERLLSPWQMVLWVIVGLLIVGAAFYFGASGLGLSAGTQPTATFPVVLHISPTLTPTPPYSAAPLPSTPSPAP